jgi:hypothetical protein
LNVLDRYLLYFPEENHKQLDQGEIIEILDQAKDREPEWHEVMVNANIDSFEMSYEESVSYFEHLETVEYIRCTNGPNPDKLPLDNKKSNNGPGPPELLVYDKKRVFVASSLDKSSKNPKTSSMKCHHCGKNSNNMTDCRGIFKFKKQKKARFESKSGPGKKSLAFLFKEINELKRYLKPERTERSKKSTKEG